jgi:hypothetical protein
LVKCVFSNFILALRVADLSTIGKKPITALYRLHQILFSLGHFASNPPQCLCHCAILSIFKQIFDGFLKDYRTKGGGN